MKRKLVAVSGGSGMVGRVLVKKLLKRGYLVRVLTRSDKYKKVGGEEVIFGDIVQGDGLRRLVMGCDNLIHLAIYQNSRDCHREKFFETNVLGSKRVLELAREEGVRLVMVSSAVVFEDSGNGMADENWQKIEGDTNNWYNQTKLEQYKLWLGSRTVIDSVLVYPTIVFDKRSFCGRLMKGVGLGDMLLGGNFFGSVMLSLGKRNRLINMVEVEDLAKGVILAMERGGRGEDYILGGINIRADEYLSVWRHKLGIRVNPSWLIGVVFLLVRSLVRFGCWRRILDSMWLAANKNMNFSNEKAKKELGFKPAYEKREDFDRMFDISWDKICHKRE